MRVYFGVLCVGEYFPSIEERRVEGEGGRSGFARKLVVRCASTGFSMTRDVFYC